MLYEKATNPVETSENFAQNEQTFQIGDLGFVLEILHSKLYANPLRTMIQEIISNAVDANIESGKPEIPVNIHIPSFYDKTFFIQDCGIGITKQRMSEVFINYGSSTKRKTNDFIGGFGIGAKTPFAYSDNFTIETVTADGYRRTYFAYLGEGNIGRLNLLKEEKVDLPTGTKIIIPVKSGDSDKISDYIKEVCRYFPLQPTIENYDENEPFFGEINWLDLQCPKITNIRVDQSERIPIVLIGNIPYPVHNNYTYGLPSNCGIVMDFEVGELTVTANREKIEESETNISKIKARYNSVINILRTKVQCAIDGHNTFKNAHEAFVTYNDLIQKLGLGITDWRNKISLRSYLSLENVQEFSLYNDDGLPEVSCRRDMSIPLHTKVHLLIKREGTNSKDVKRRIKRYMDLNDSKRVYYVNHDPSHNPTPMFEKFAEHVGYSYLDCYEPVAVEKVERKKLLLTEQDLNITDVRENRYIRGEKLLDIFLKPAVYIVETNGTYIFDDGSNSGKKLNSCIIPELIIDKEIQIIKMGVTSYKKVKKYITNIWVEFKPYFKDNFEALYEKNKLRYLKYKLFNHKNSRKYYRNIFNSNFSTNEVGYELLKERYDFSLFHKISNTNSLVAHYNNSDQFILQEIKKRKPQVLHLILPIIKIFKEIKQKYPLIYWTYISEDRNLRDQIKGEMEFYMKSKEQTV